MKSITMKKNYKIYLLLAIATSITSIAKSQTYSAKVSRDSVGILAARIEALKASVKVQELKIKESEEETEVEKLRIKLLEANDIAKKSATQNSDNSGKIKTGNVDIKASTKLAKQAKNDMESAQKALERYNKQINKVEDVRTEIQKEEQKLTYKKPLVSYKYN